MFVYAAFGKDESVYIGATKRNSLSTRVSEHKYKSKTECVGKFRKSIAENGIDFFDFEVLSLASSFDELYDLEKSFISLFDSYKNGLNSSLGGIENRGIKVTQKRREAGRKTMALIYNSDAIKKARKNSLTPEKQRARSLISAKKRIDKMPVFHIKDRHTGEILGSFKSHKECADKYGYSISTVRCGLIRNAPTRKHVFEYAGGVPSA